ncbi:ABC transporter substrate-binding protein [Cerasicoccus arenae]|uniref:Extracellular solute-binding protein n=1 Tax=Cerasicoccus arenae TaxID=424488 RepID=A0A8J3DH92_9BACT|nr:extracellular solute-binding protein [Cerasicoccus arenae]MBK1856671.1 extracellular solute-binding protein [Cerasicoccus arenae]GHB98809.1 hypothetical protein GCM10007047_13530 [Cerasicoccus arenae]
MSKEEGKKGFNWNWLAIAALIIAYAFSAGRFFVYSAQNNGDANSKKTIRVAHWQLEPGYREALDWAMNEYNNLPHVKEAGIEVVQIPLPQSVYNQFMNVHLISGTAPDISAAGNTKLIQGNAIGRFYASVGEYVNQVNPYNSVEKLSPDLDPELREYLANASWKDTFLDGMEGGWRQELNDYYSIPISNAGGMRLYYNMSLLKKGKTFLREALAKKSQPEWLKQVWLREVDGSQQGYLPDNERLRKWVANDDEVPQTMGQLILYCFSIKAMAKAKNMEYLVPISVGNSSSGDPVFRYQNAFFNILGKDLEYDGNTGISGLEAFDGLYRNQWNFDSKPMKAYFEVAKLFTQFYPVGYLGLDREQTQRRFVLGDAAIFSSGGWDAAGVFKGASESNSEEKRFKVSIAPPTMPAPDERWGDMIKYMPSEANFKTGVPLSINKQTQHLDWALDFLMFISSQPVNEEFNRIAAWLPATVGSETIESMRGFEPIVEGFPSYESFNPDNSRAAIKSQWSGMSKLVITGGMDYEEFASKMTSFLDSQRQGIKAYWFHDRQGIKDRTRALDRTLSVEELNLTLDDNAKSAERFRSLFYQSLTDDEGVNLEMIWRKLHPDQPFPTL